MATDESIPHRAFTPGRPPAKTQELSPYQWLTARQRAGLAELAGQIAQIEAEIRVSKDGEAANTLNARLQFLRERRRTARDAWGLPAEDES